LQGKWKNERECGEEELEARYELGLEYWYEEGQADGYTDGYRNGLNEEYDRGFSKGYDEASRMKESVLVEEAAVSK
jgi:flagellar biosynthesis/type III secretory pathway protein FliH